MFLTMKVAFRNISRQKKRSFLLAGAIAFGMMVITLMNALTGGAVINIRDNFSHALGGHVFITGREWTEAGQMIMKIRPDANLDRLLEENARQIEAFTRRSQAMPSLIFGSQQTMHLLYGVDFSEEDRLIDSLVVVEGSLAELGKRDDIIVLPEPVAERLGVEVGETVLIRLETLTGQQNVGEARVAAFIKDQEELGLSAAYTSRANLNSLLGMEPHEYQILNMFVTDLDLVDQFARTFREGLLSPEEAEEAEDEPEVTVTVAGMPIDPGTRTQEVTPWEGTRYQVMNINQIMEAVELVVGVLNRVGLVIFLILLVVTMVGITNTFRMIMIERTKEIGTMRAFGMQQKQVKRIFLWEAVLLGLLGCLGGLVIAGVIALAVGSVSLNTDPSLQFFLNNGRITFSLPLQDVAVNVALVILTSLLAAYWPARAAAKMSPMKALSSHT
ncbi:MAG: FtsX-like permease family protein [Bacillota bacterium]|jgi:putative ABC transport system permease protein|nr:FtsX-like permease family protein [Bacillota bacterium]NLJ02970.1 ABC transporter permease [Bacillota bacterium]